MHPFKSLTPDEIRNYDPIHLGSGGFCFVVAELLKEKYPQAELWRLTNRERMTYDHVFVCIDGKPCDIHGFRSVDEMRFDLDNKSLIEVPADAQAIQDYFYHQYSTEQLTAVRTVLYDAVMRLNL